jgi:hypothetical protein
VYDENSTVDKIAALCGCPAVQHREREQIAGSSMGDRGFGRDAGRNAGYRGTTTAAAVLPSREGIGQASGASGTHMHAE